jgi:S1-C subfamily serine protease
MKRNFLEFLLTVAGTVVVCILVYYIGGPWKQNSTPINAPAIAEWQQSEHMREVMSPSTFDIEARLFFREKDPNTNKEMRTFCSEAIGGAYTVNKKGYFGTNNHIINSSHRKDACLEKLSKKRKVPIYLLTGVRFDTEYYLTSPEKLSFRVSVIKTFPKIDLAVLRIPRTWQEVGMDIFKDPPKYPDSFIHIEFRTGSPSIIDGKVVSGKGKYILPDEPIAFMGSPLGLPFTITTGKLGNNVFREFENVLFVHYIAPTNTGNSGGPLYSLLDFKFIGMSTMMKFDNGHMSNQSGMIPFWQIQSALNTIKME